MKKSTHIKAWIAMAICGQALLAPSDSLAQTPLNRDVMSITSDGYYARACDMMSHGNYSGVIDQLNRAFGQDSPMWSTTTGSDDSRLDATFMLLRAAFERNDQMMFRQLYPDFIEEYEGTPQAVEARLLYGDLLFFEGRDADAVEAYGAVDLDALDPSKQALYTYRLGYALVRTGFFTEARERFDSLKSNPSYSDASTFYLAYIDYVEGNLNAAREGFGEVGKPMARELGADFYITQIDFQQGDFPGVISRGRELLPTVRKEWVPELNRIIGESYYNMGDKEQAESYLRSYVNQERNPQLSALYDLGVICYDSHSYEEARKYFRQAESPEENAMTQSTYLYLGQLEARAGDYSTARIAFGKAYDLNIDPKVSETALYNYAVATLNGGQEPFGSSAKMLETFVSKYPDSPYASKVDEYLSTACYNDKDYEGALRYIERIRKPTKANREAEQKILFQLGVQAMSLKNYGTAAGYMKRAAGMASQADRGIAAQAYLWEGDALYALADYPGASEAYTNFVKESSSGTENRALGLYNLGYSLYQEKKFTEARKRLQEALKAKPALSASLANDCRLRIADCDYYAGNISAALDAYASLSSENGSMDADYAAFQHANMMGASGNNEAKIQELTAMLDKWPASQWNADARMELVNALCATGNPAKATEEYGTLLRDYSSAPQTRKAALAIAAAWQEQDDMNRAKEVYQELIRKWPTSAEAVTAVNYLKNIYTDEGDTKGFLAFLDSVPNAPRPDAAEMESMAFNAAYNQVKRNDNDLTPLIDYLNKYPKGVNSDNALLLLATLNDEKGDDKEALRYLEQLLTSRPDSESVPAALMLKGEILESEGNVEEAQIVWQQLLSKGGSLYAPEAYAGLMRTASTPEQTVSYADKLMASSGVDSDQLAEAELFKAKALLALSRFAEADSLLKTLASTPQTEQGAEAAVLLGESLYKRQQLAEARKTLEAFIDSDTSQFYWLARGYIVLADVYAEQGDMYKAKEYLKALKSNYPGKEADIRQMIDERLSRLELK